MKNWINDVVMEILTQNFPNDKFYLEEKKEKIKNLNIFESLNWIETNFDSSLKYQFCQKTKFTLEDLHYFHKIYLKF